MSALMQGPLGDYGIARSLIQTPGWNPLEHTDARGNPAGGKKRGGGFSIRGGRRRRPSSLHYMDSGLDGLNTMFPTAASMPYDPFYLKNVAQQAKNSDPNGYWTGPKVHNPKLFNVFNEELGSGFDVSDYAVGGPLAAPDDYDSGHSYYDDYDTGYVGAGDYSGMSYGL